MPTEDHPVLFLSEVNTSRATSVLLKDGCVTSASVASGANIAASKLVNRIHAVLAQDNGSAVVAQTRAVYQAKNAGTLVNVYATVMTAAVGDSTITIDVKKNGTTVLTGTFNIDSGDAANAKVSGTLDTTTIAADDVLSVVITVSAGTGTLPQGVLVSCIIDENGT